MKKLFSIITLIILFASCKTMQPVIKIVTKDSVITKDTTIYKTVTQYLPGDTVELWQAFPCPGVKIDTQIKKGNMTLSAKTLDGKLKIDCKSDSLQHIIDSVTRLKQKEVYHTEITEVPVKVPTPFIPKWVWYLVAYTVLSLGWKFRSPLLSLIKKFK